MKRTIQTRVDAIGDIHLDFSGFVGRDCRAEEDRLRRELAALGLNVDMKSRPRCPAHRPNGSYNSVAPSLGPNESLLS
jgi:hypothetical protein